VSKLIITVIKNQLHGLIFNHGYQQLNIRLFIVSEHNSRFLYKIIGSLSVLPWDLTVLWTFGCQNWNRPFFESDIIIIFIFKILGPGGSSILEQIQVPRTRGYKYIKYPPSGPPPGGGGEYRGETVVLSRHPAAAVPSLRPPARPPAKEECRRIVSVASRASQCAFLHKQLTLLLLLPPATIAACSSILSTPMQQQQHKTKKKKKEAELTKKKKKGGTHKEDRQQQQQKATSAITSKSYYYATSASTRPSSSSAAHYILTWPSHRLICCCCYGVPNLLLVISAPRFALYRSWLSKSWGVLLLLLSGDKNQSSSLLVDFYTDLCHTRSFSPSL